MVAPLLIQAEAAEVAGHRSKVRVEEEGALCWMVMVAEVVGPCWMVMVAGVVGQSLKGVAEVEGGDYLSKAGVV
jgi:hypothetical protein